MNLFLNIICATRTPVTCFSLESSG